MCCRSTQHTSRNFSQTRAPFRNAYSSTNGDPARLPNRTPFHRTCYFQGRIPADDADPSLGIGGVTIVRADVGLRALVVDDPEEEELAAGQQHPVWLRVLIGRDDRFAVAVPRYDGGRVALRLAVQRRRFILRHVLVLRMLHDPGISYLLYTWRRRKNIKQLVNN